MRAPEGSRPSEGISCDNLLVEVNNESGMSIAVLWVGTDGEEVQCEGDTCCVGSSSGSERRG